MTAPSPVPTLRACTLIRLGGRWIKPGTEFEAGRRWQNGWSRAVRLRLWRVIRLRPGREAQRLRRPGKRLAKLLLLNLLRRKLPREC